MSQADFNKFLKLEKRLGKLIDNPRGSSSRALMKRKDNLRRRLKLLEPKIKGFEDGGLAMAIEKVKAKEMKDGGNVPKPKLRPKSLKADKTESLDKEFSKNVARTNKMNMDNVKKKKDGGLIGGQVKLDKNKDGKISGADFAMMAKGGKVEEYGGGGSVKGGKMSCRGMGAAIKGGGFSIR